VIVEQERLKAQQQFNWFFRGLPGRQGRTAAPMRGLQAIDPLSLALLPPPANIISSQCVSGSLPGTIPYWIERMVLLTSASIK
jgi:hypothetical protein